MPQNANSRDVQSALDSFDKTTIQSHVAAAHPSLEPILKRTLGIPLFQEQLLRMAMLCANFSGVFGSNQE